MAWADDTAQQSRTPAANVRIQRAADAVETDVRFLEGLRQRRLYALAEAYCHEVAGRDDLTTRRRVRLAVELSQTLVAQALDSPPDARAPLWKRAEAAVRDLGLSETEGSWALLADVQAALVRLARGELARQMAATSPDGQRHLGEARQDLREAVRQLDVVRQRIEARLRGLATPSGKPRATVSKQNATMDRNALLSLQRHVQFELARALAHLGQCFAPESADRISALSRAVEHFERLAALSTVDPLAWESRVELIRCLRFLGDRQAALRRLEQLERQSPPAAIAYRAQAERIELLLDAGKVNEAAVLAEKLLGTLEGDTSPAGEATQAMAERELAALRAYLAAWQQAHRQQRKPQKERQKEQQSQEEQNAQQTVHWQKAAERLVAHIAARRGTYWARRAESLMAANIAGWSGTEDASLLTRIAESYFRAGQFDEAVVAYDRAQREAARRGDGRRAFQLGYVAASIEHQRGRHEAAAERFARLAREYDDHPQAAQTHRLAIYHLGQLLRDQADSQTLDRYLLLLEEHLARWPGAPGSDEIRLRLARLLEHRGQYARAEKLYRQVSSESEQFARAVQRLVELYEHWFNNQPHDRRARQHVAEAVDWLDRIVTGPASRHGVPDTWTDGQRAALLALARLRVEWLHEGLRRTEQLLNAALAEPMAPPEWKRRAFPWLIVVLAAEGAGDRALRFVDQLAQNDVSSTLAVLESVDRLPRPSDPKLRHDVAQLKQRVARIVLHHADAASLDANARKRAETILASSLVEAGRFDQAKQHYERLRKSAPRDADVLEQYAALLAREGSPDAWRAALDGWRELERHSPAGSPRWFRAKYGICQAHLALGNRQRAEKIYSQLQVLHPSLGGAEMRARFDQLFRASR